jgi:hypothetical protein
MKERIAILLFLVVGLAPGMAGRTKDVYIASHTDESGGDGTLRNPFDGSTPAKLDAVLRRISTGTSVHFGPGTFHTAGFSDDSPSVGFSVKPGCKYVGAGPRQTTIHLASASATSAHLGCAFCASGTRADVSGASVENMTIDVNGAGLVAANTPDLCTFGVSLPGSNNKVSNVHLINVYGHEATSREAFGLGTPASATNPKPKGNLIQNCVVDEFATGYDYGQMICITGGVARGNWVIGQTTLTSAYQAYGANAVLDGCYAFNCRTFLYMDTGDVGPLLVKNCQAWGITGEFVNLTPAAGFSHHDVRVMNNTAEFGATGEFLRAVPGGAGVRLYNMYVVNNTATQAFGEYTPVNVSNVRNFYSAGNHWLKTGSSKRKANQRSNQLPSLGSPDLRTAN